MKVIIYKYATPNTPRAIISPDDTSEQSVSLMREDILTLNFTVPEPIDFAIGDYCHFTGILYQINALPGKTRNADRSITYVLKMEAEMYDLGKTQYLFLDAENNFTDAVFNLRGTAQSFGELIIYNLNRVYPTAGWKLGFVEQTGYADESFAGNNCLQVIQTIAKTFDTEYLIEGKTIHIYRRETSSNLILEYGSGKALLSLKEDKVDSSNVITRLYAYGSSKNITASYRGGAQRLRMGDINYIEKNKNLYNIFEFTKIFDGSDGTPEIYPQRTGTVTAVYDPFNFYDTTMDFNLNTYLISGVSAKITFNTGILNGYTFDVAVGGYNHTTKKFTILKNTAETSIDVPSVGYAPVVGDTYVITDIRMPQSYIDNAELRLRAAAQDFLDKNSVPSLVYSGICNAIYFKQKNIKLALGQMALVKDDQLQISKVIRITGYTRNVNDNYLYTVELSERVLPQSIIVKLLNNI